jgi:DNA-binding NtrC family response regulator
VLSLKGAIDAAELPAEILAATPAQKQDSGIGELGQLPYEEARAAFERNYLMEVLQRHGGNLSRAAATIGIHRQTLQYKLKQLGLRKSWSE